jgi:hypothetical protein
MELPTYSHFFNVNEERKDGFSRFLCRVRSIPKESTQNKSKSKKK